jgi:hypothetical protein
MWKCSDIQCPSAKYAERSAFSKPVELKSVDRRLPVAVPVPIARGLTIPDACGQPVPCAWRIDWFVQLSRLRDRAAPTGCTWSTGNRRTRRPDA